MSDPNGSHGGAANPEAADSLAHLATPPHRDGFFDRIMGGEENPVRLWVLLAILTLSLHALGLTWLKGSEPPIEEARPLPPMDVTLVAAEIPKPLAAPQPAPPPPPSKKTEPPPPKPKPVVKPAPPKPVVKKIVKPLEPKPVLKSPEAPRHPEPEPERESAPSEPPAREEESARHHAPSEAPAPSPSPAKAEAMSPAPASISHGKLLSKPEPPYPPAAKSRGLSGKVKVKIWVSADAEVEKVEVVESSGHDILDEAAVETVQNQWRFSAAKKGDTAVSDTYLIVIKFTLKQAD